MSEDISLSLEGKDGVTISIQARQSMMHPEQCTFQVSEPVYPDNSSHFPDRESGKGSPLVDGLYGIDGIADVLVNHDTVRVVITGNASWDDAIPMVGSAIRDALVGDGPAIADAVTENQLPPEELQKRVENVLETVINPAVAAHGGYVGIIDVVKNTVFLEFGGGCQGCGMINVTLKYGVERAIREAVPEVGDILDTTDHASGRNPYYAPSAK